MDTKKQNNENLLGDFSQFMPDQDMMKRMMEVPTQMTTVVLETARKTQEASLDYLRQVEKIQREYIQEVSSVWGQVLPGESNIWDAQNKMVETGFEMFNQMTSMGKKAA